MSLVFGVIWVLLMLFVVSLFIRLVYDWVQMFARGWRPQGAALVLATFIYTVTDPPVKWLRRTIPPLRLGAVSLDLGFLILLLVTGILMSITSGLAASFA
ncbi:YggT family protein [Tersicoccus sp. MR15.9]|uniref:YggT family protein n=1 Tax=Tersicoccus mangrovi TaxID=3121635 RepID=UPI002FE6077C